MNINTHTLLNSLLSKIDPSLKSKIENLASDGKVNITTLSKDKGIQTLLNEMFKEISVGTKNKSDILTLLENSKHSLKFKNIATDLKQITNLLKSDLKITPELEKLTTILKNSIVDITTLNEKVLRNSIVNSGVFLESKLAQQNNSVLKNLTLLTTQLKATLSILNDIQLDEKTNTFTNNSSNLKKTITQNLQNTQTTLNNTNISDELKSKIQGDVQNILKKIESSQQSGLKIENSLSLLKNATEQIDKLDQKILTNNIKNDISLNLKEVVSQVKNNFLTEGFLGLKKAIILIMEQVENISTNNTVEIKKELKTIEGKIETLQDNKTNETKINTVKDLSSQVTKIIDKINSLNIQELLKNNLGNIKNISEDIKSVLLKIKEMVEKDIPNEMQAKELKTNIDKVLSQIDYYQLASYTSNSNHSFISFMQDELNDVDIKFNNGNKDEFSCMINLTLQQYGDLKVLLLLDKKNGLSINIGVEKQNFKQMIQTSLQELRVKINSIGLSLINLNVFDLEKEKGKSNELKAYGANSNLDFGLDIKV